MTYKTKRYWVHVGQLGSKEDLGPYGNDVEMVKAKDYDNALANARRAALEEAATKVKLWEVYYGSMAEGQNEPEFGIYIKCELQMRRLAEEIRAAGAP